MEQLPHSKKLSMLFVVSSLYGTSKHIRLRHSFRHKPNNIFLPTLWLHANTPTTFCGLLCHSGRNIYYKTKWWSWLFLNMFTVCCLRVSLITIYGHQTCLLGLNKTAYSSRRYDWMQIRPRRCVDRSDIQASPHSACGLSLQIYLGWQSGWTFVLK